MDLSGSFLKHFDKLEDPRTETHNKRHSLNDILVIAILAIIGGADTWVDVCEFAESKEDWLTTFLELPNGIPSHDTFGRVFALLNPEVFEQCFCEWIASLSIDISKEIIAIDGKSVRRAHAKGERALHLVSAWASENRVMLGQVRTEAKSNEIETIPELLKMIDVKGAIVTIDAMGCQKEIAQEIINKEADYVLSLKDNQPSLHQAVASIFDQGKETTYAGMMYQCKIEKLRSGEHGRIETRKYTVINSRDYLPFELSWPGLKSIGKLEVTRTYDNHQVEYSTRYFLSSLHFDIDNFMRAVRKHWDIEINLHWSLDVSFNEDLSRVRIGHAAENLSIVRRIALNLLKQETSKKIGISAKRKRAGWDNQYLLKVLSGLSTARAE